MLQNLVELMFQTVQQNRFWRSSNYCFLRYVVCHFIWNTYKIFQSK